MIIYKSIYDLDKPSSYIFKLPPNLQYKEQILEWVKPFRQDVLDNKVAYGMNQRLLTNQINENPTT